MTFHTGLLLAVGLVVALGLVVLIKSPREKPLQDICLEMETLPRTSEAFRGWVGEKMLAEYPMSSVLGCMWELIGEEGKA